jgi:heat shock protein HslJ
VSQTELEEDLRASFERAAASVPFTPNLVTRASTGARHQKRRTWAASAAAAAAIAALAVGGFALQPNGPTATPEPAASPRVQVTPSTTPSIASPAAMLRGTWRPVKLPDFTTLRSIRAEDPILIFKPDGTWSGSDGCNSITGTFTVGRRGEFASIANPQRLAECDNVPHTGVLAAARRISADRQTLRFFNADGRQVATYARAG